MVSIAHRLESIERRKSPAAIVCERLALFCLPFLLIVVLGHRFGAIDTLSFYWLLALGGLLLVLSLIAGIWAFQQLWSDGDEGGLRATRGTFIAIALLLPYLWGGYLAFALPQLYDISTDLEDAPNFEAALDDRSDGMNIILESPTELDRTLQLSAYPRVSARRYPLGSTRVFRAVVALIAERGWVILTSATVQGDAPVDEEGSGLVAKPTTDSEGRPLTIPLPIFRPDDRNLAQRVEIETVEVSPIGRSEQADTSEQDERYIEAVASSFLFGFESDVVIRLVEEEEGTLVDMRSVSRHGPHDLGDNARRIVSFMEDLDTALQGLGQGS